MIWEQIFRFLFDFALIMLPVSILISRERNLKKAVQKLGFVPMPLGKLFKKSLKLFLAMFAVTLWISLILLFLNLNDLELVSESIQGAKAVLPLFFWLVVVRVVSEEVFFRGFLVKKIGIVASSAVFAIFHIGYGSVAEVIGAFILGLVLAKAFQLNKNLYPNIFAHIVYNAMAMFLFM